MKETPAIYIPDNADLADVLAGGRGFHPDQAAMLLHFIGSKVWMGDVGDDGFARLNSGILRQWIQSRALKAIMECFNSAGVLKTAGHCAGHFATGYRITRRFDGAPVRRVVEYEPLALKLAGWRAAYRVAGDDPLLKKIIASRKPVLDHQRDSLAVLGLPVGPAEMVEALAGQVDPWHVAFVTSCIEHHDHDGLSICGFGRRLHSIVTRTSSRLRPRLLLGGDVVAEVDIGNSQPMLLAILANQAHAQHKKPMRNIMEAPGRSRGLGSGLMLSGVPSCEAESFLEVCESGCLYDELADQVNAQINGRDAQHKKPGRGPSIMLSKLDRDGAKTGLFRDVLFGRPHIEGRITRAFGQRWPTLLKAIGDLKRRCGYKALAKALQRLESTIMLDTICPRIMRELPGLAFLTIHDSAMLVAESAESVREIMLDEFQQWGVTPTIRIKAGMDAGGK